MTSAKLLAVGIAITLLLTILPILQESSTPDNLDTKFESWKQEYGVIISGKQQAYRNIIFGQNLKKIEEHNSKGDQVTYTLGLNQFAHLSEKQFSSMYSNRIFNQEHQIYTAGFDYDMSEVNTEIDWQKLDKVTAVQAQGSCDAGYAFCTKSLLESYFLIKDNSTALLSAQQIIDCSKEYETFGCRSGKRTGTIKYLQEKGITTSAAYPYEGLDSGTCKTTTGTYKLPANIFQADGCDNLTSQLLKSPMTAAVNTENWQLYKTGIFNNCGDSVNHDVFLIGVNNTNWRIKNSWGVRWGEYGYIRLAIGNTCGICTAPGFGITF